MNKLKEMFLKLTKGGDKTLSNLIFTLMIGIAIIGCSGMILNTVPKAKETINKTNIQEVKPTISVVKKDNDTAEGKLEKRLETILGSMQGVGEVKVMVTIDYGKETVVATDTSRTQNTTKEKDAQGGTRDTENSENSEKMVLVNKGTGSNEPFVLKEREPVVKGVLILAEGGNNQVIREQLITTAQALLNISQYKVQVYKLNKEN